MLYPLGQCRKGIVSIGGRTATAVPHPGDWKDAHKSIRVAVIALINFVVPRERVIDRKHRVGYAMRHDQPAAMGSEGAQIARARGDVVPSGVDESRVGRIYLGSIAIEIEPQLQFQLYPQIVDHRR